MDARLFQEPKNAMQSGKARAGRWILEHEPQEPKRADPLMGWAGSGDTQRQVVLRFPTREAALAYAEKAGLRVEEIVTPPKTMKIQAYADNFR